MSDETLPNPNDRDDVPPASGDETRTVSSPAGSKTITVWLQEKGIDVDMLDVGTSPTSDMRAGSDDRYTIGVELSRGGMGAVLSATDLNLRREVAMKVVLRTADLYTNHERVMRFLHEAQVTGQLEHPSIVPVYELGEDDKNGAYYTMKYIRGNNLGSLLKGIKRGDAPLQKRLTLNRLLDIFLKASDALAFAHARGVVHRDLKPDNIMVGDFGEVLVVDWGLAKVLGKSKSKTAPEVTTESGRSPTGDASVESSRDTAAGSSMHTMDGAVMGTPAYMSPEQAQGDLASIAPASDVYSMGGILYSILTLEAPITGASLEEILAKAKRGEIIPPDLREGARPHCPDGAVPPSLSAVTMRAMAVDPADRYGSMQDLQADVQAYMDGFATRAENAGFLRLLQLFIARHRSMFVAGLVTAVVVTAAIAVGFVINLKARRVAEFEQGHAEHALVGAQAERTQAEAAQNDAEAARSEAVNALQAFKDEQSRSLASRRTAAPALVRAALALIDAGDLSGASLQVEVAREFDSQLSSAHLLAAQLFIVEKRYSDALKALNAYSALEPDDPLASQLKEHCGKVADLPEKELLAAFASVLGAQKAWQLAYRLDLDAEARWELYRTRLQTAWPGPSLDSYFKRADDGSIHVDLNAVHPTDLSPLLGIPVTELETAELKGISDLSPLRGMPLRRLNIRNTGVADLSPLIGAPLIHLDASYTQIRDVSALAGLPLKWLDLTHVKPLDISALKGMPLEYLNLTEARELTDISALKGMPLRELNLHYCGANNFTPLSSCTTLRKLILHRVYMGSTEALRGLQLEDFAIYGAGEDLGFLKGMPLKKLKLQTWQQTIEPLAGLPLEDLHLAGTEKLFDLSPLRGMPLKTLHIENLSQLKDLSALRGAALTNLTIIGSSTLKDLDPIRSLKSLKILVLPEHLDPMDVINDLPELELIGVGKKEYTVEAFRKQRIPK